MTSMCRVSEPITQVTLLGGGVSTNRAPKTTGVEATVNGGGE